MKRPQATISGISIRSGMRRCVFPVARRKAKPGSRAIIDFPERLADTCTPGTVSCQIQLISQQRPPHLCLPRERGTPESARRGLFGRSFSPRGEGQRMRGDFPRPRWRPRKSEERSDDTRRKSADGPSSRGAGASTPTPCPTRGNSSWPSRAVTSIEINGTFYRAQTPDTYRKWAGETPDGFVFSLKAPRYAPGKRVLAEAGPSIERFFESGVTSWAKSWAHPLAVRANEEIARRFRRLSCAAAGGSSWASLASCPGSAARQLRLPPSSWSWRKRPARRLRSQNSAGLPTHRCGHGRFPLCEVDEKQDGEGRQARAGELKDWVRRARGWNTGGRDAFVYFIDGAKERAPAAARAFLAWPEKREPGRCGALRCYRCSSLS